MLSISTQEHGQIPMGQPPKGGCVFLPLHLCQKPSTKKSCRGAGPALPAHYTSPVVWGHTTCVALQLSITSGVSASSRGGTSSATKDGAALSLGAGPVLQGLQTLIWLRAPAQTTDICMWKRQALSRVGTTDPLMALHRLHGPQVST